MKKISIILIFILLVVAACSSYEGETLNFQGEGENWKIKYDVVNNDSSQNTTSTIVNIGEEEAPELFDYTLSAMLSGRESVMVGAKLNENDFIEESQVNNGSKVQRDEIILIEQSGMGK